MTNNCYTPPFPPCETDVYSYPDFASFPTSGAEDKLYIDLNTGATYFWNGTTYQESTSSPINVIGEEVASTNISLAATETLNVKLNTNTAHTKPYSDGATKTLYVPNVKPTVYAGNFITPGTIPTTGTIVSSVTVNVTFPNTYFIFSLNCDVQSSSIDALSLAVMEGITTLFPNWTQTTEIPPGFEINFVRSEVIQLGVGTHTIDFVLFSVNGLVTVQNQGRAYIISQ